MILIESGLRNADHFDAKVIFAEQLAERGYQVIIDEATTPPELGRSQHYMAAPYLGPVASDRISTILIIGADDLDEEPLTTLRAYDLPPSTSVTAIARFPDPQSASVAGAKIAHAINRDPNVLNLSQIQSKPLLTSSCVPLFGTENGMPALTSKSHNVFIFIPPDLLEDPSTPVALSQLAGLAGLKCHVVTNALGLKLIREAHHEAIFTYNYHEFSPTALGQIADVAAYFGSGKPTERVAVFASNLLQRAGIFIDCTKGGELAKSGAPILRGTLNLGEFVNTVDTKIIANCEQICRKVKQDKWLQKNAIGVCEDALSLSTGRSTFTKKTVKKSETRHLFIPTNGVGLGHAQRSSIIASHMDQNSSCAFLAFPSCLPMLQSKGFDCLPLVQKSQLHDDAVAHDLFNYLTLRKFVQWTDQLVFDGGHVFDSVFRTIVEKRLRAVWIRRGLWRTSKANSITQDRAQVFKKIIVPGEAFEELNDANSFTQNVHCVGPIVQDGASGKTDVEGLRNRLKERFDSDFDRLVVTMLGAGFRGDRLQHLQMIGSLFDRRSDCLNLIVAWPNAIVFPALYQWKNSKVVKATNALALCRASDFAISASGYNSFHELMYHHVPSIFVPQVAILDDQERRARAASGRDLAVTVPATQLLRLEKEILAFLDGDRVEEIRSKLQSFQLPDLGNKDAARIVERNASV